MQQTVQSSSTPGFGRAVFISPYLNWAWLAPLLAGLVWWMSGWGGATGGARAMMVVLTALLAIGLPRQAVVLVPGQRPTPAVRLHVALVMGLWLGLVSALQRGVDEFPSVLIPLVMSGAVFGILMALFLKPASTSLKYWQDEDVFQRGGARAMAARLWPLLALVLLLVAMARAGQGLAQAAFVPVMLFLVAPPFRRTRAPVTAVEWIGGRLRTGVVAALLGAYIWLHWASGMG